MHYFLAETHTFKMEGKFSKYFVVFFLGPEFIAFSLGTCRKNRFYAFFLRFYSAWKCVSGAYFVVLFCVCAYFPSGARFV